MRKLLVALASVGILSTAFAAPAAARCSPDVALVCGVIHKATCTAEGIVKKVDPDANMCIVF
jgi:hypothetical protein